MHQCPHCDEIFVDEESFEKHKLTHQGEGGAAPAAPAPAAPAAPDPPPTTSRRAARAAAAAAATTTEAAVEPAAAPETPTRSFGGARQEAVSVPVPEIVGDDLGEALPFEDGTGGLGPMEWEKDAPPRTNPFAPAYKFLEDFSEWLFFGLQKGVGAFGLSLVPALAIAIRGTVLLLIGLLILGSGMWVGRKYGPWLMGQKPDEPPLLPPQRVVAALSDDKKQATQAVLDFYNAIDGKSYSVAYDSLSTDWKKELSYPEFERGYRNTQSVRCTVIDSQTVADGKVEVKVEIEVVENGTSRRFAGTYQTERREDGWKLDSASVREAKNAADR